MDTLAGSDRSQQMFGFATDHCHCCHVMGS